MSFTKLRNFAQSEDKKYSYILEHTERPVKSIRILKMNNDGLDHPQSTEVISGIALASEEMPTCCDATRIGSSTALAVGYQKGHIRAEDLSENGWVARCLPPNELKESAAVSVVRWNPYFTSQLLGGYNSSAGLVSLFSAPCTSPLTTRTLRSDQPNASVVAAEWVPNGYPSLTPSHAAISVNSRGGGSFQVSIIDFRSDDAKEDFRLGGSSTEGTIRRPLSARNSQVGASSITSEQQHTRDVIAASGLAFHPTRPLLATYGNESTSLDSNADLSPIIQIWDLRSTSAPVAQFIGKSIASKNLDLRGGVWDVVWARASTYASSPTPSSQRNNDHHPISLASDDEDYDDTAPVALFGATAIDQKQHKGAGVSTLGILSAKDLSSESSKKRAGTTSLSIQTRDVGEPITSIAPCGLEILCYSHHGYLTSIPLKDISKGSSAGTVTSFPSALTVPSFVSRADKGFGINLNVNGSILVSELNGNKMGSDIGLIDQSNTLEWTVLAAFVETYRQRQQGTNSQKRYPCLVQWGAGVRDEPRTKQQIAKDPVTVPGLQSQPEVLSFLREALLWAPSAPLASSSSNQVDPAWSDIPWLNGNSNRFRCAFITYAQRQYAQCANLLRASNSADPLHMVTAMLAFVVDAQQTKTTTNLEHTLKGLNESLAKDIATVPSASYLMALIDLISGTKPLDLLASAWRGTPSRITSPVSPTNYAAMPNSPEKRLLPFDLLIAATLDSELDPRKVIDTVLSFPITTLIPIQLLIKGINQNTLQEVRFAISGPEDVQCAVMFFAPLGIQLEKVQEKEDKKKIKPRTAPTQWRQWHEQYRRHLDDAGHILLRAEYDLSLRQLFDFGLVQDNEGNMVSGEAPREVEFKHSCEWSLHLNPTKKALGPHDCTYPMPKCGVCGINIERALPAHLSHPSQWLAWCTNCGHGGHSGHLDEWFERHVMCPFPNCPCSCRSSVNPGVNGVAEETSNGQGTGREADLVGAISSNVDAIVSVRPSTNAAKWGDVAYHFVEFPPTIRH